MKLVIIDDILNVVDGEPLPYNLPIEEIEINDNIPVCQSDLACKLKSEFLEIDK